MDRNSRTFQQTIVGSAAWQAWKRQNIIDPKFDVQESEKEGWLTPTHFHAFITFAVTQHKMNLILLLRDHVRGENEHLETALQLLTT